jgi:hypothetical protein
VPGRALVQNAKYFVPQLFIETPSLKIERVQMTQRAATVLGLLLKDDGRVLRRALYADAARQPITRRCIGSASNRARP